MNAGRCLGIRVEPSKFHWVVVAGSSKEPELIDHGSASAPVHCNEADALVWYRTRLLQLLETHKPDGIAVKYPEPIARSTGKEGPKKRLRIEGVLIEAAASQKVQVLTGSLRTIGSRMGSSKPKDYLNQDEMRRLNTKDLPPLVKEALLTAISGLPKD